MEYNLNTFHDVSVQTESPKITISHSAITISRSVIELLGRPEFIKVLFNQDVQVIAITVTNTNEISKIRCDAGNGRLDSVRFKNPKFIHSLSEILEYDLSQNELVIEGSYSKLQHALFFPLDQTKKNYKIIA